MSSGVRGHAVNHLLPSTAEVKMLGDITLPPSPSRFLHDMDKDDLYMKHKNTLF
jgi:hypothetical protein